MSTVIHVSVEVSEENHLKLRALAEDRGVTVEVLAHKAVRDYVEDHAKLRGLAAARGVGVGVDVLVREAIRSYLEALVMLEARRDAETLAACPDCGLLYWKPGPCDHRLAPGMAHTWPVRLTASPFAPTLAGDAPPAVAT